EQLEPAIAARRPWQPLRGHRGPPRDIIAAVLTADDSDDPRDDDDAPIPGVVVVWSDRQPTLASFRIANKDIVLGRELLGDGDDRISRSHVRVAAAPDAFSITDLGSRNGTIIQGVTHVGETVEAAAGGVLRIGRTIVLLVPDTRIYEGAS